jgi:hypothetical protein
MDADHAPHDTGAADAALSPSTGEAGNVTVVPALTGTAPDDCGTTAGALEPSATEPCLLEAAESEGVLATAVVAGDGATVAVCTLPPVDVGLVGGDEGTFVEQDDAMADDALDSEGAGAPSMTAPVDDGEGAGRLATISAVGV